MKNDENYDQKVRKAVELLDELKETINQIIWTTKTEVYTAERGIIPMIGEQTKYDIKALKLHKKDQEKFLRLIDRAMGVYHDHFPHINKPKK